MSVAGPLPVDMPVALSSKGMPMCEFAEDEFDEDWEGLLVRLQPELLRLGRQLFAGKRNHSATNFEDAVQTVMLKLLALPGDGFRCKIGRELVTVDRTAEAVAGLAERLLRLETQRVIRGARRHHQQIGCNEGILAEASSSAGAAEPIRKLDAEDCLDALGEAVAHDHKLKLIVELIIAAQRNPDTPDFNINDHEAIAEALSMSVADVRNARRRLDTIRARLAARGYTWPSTE